MQKFTKCVLASTQQRQIDRFLTVNPFSHDASKQGMAVAPAECLPDVADMRFDPGLYRAALYDAMYRRDFGGRDVLPTFSQPEPDIAAEVRSDGNDDAGAFLTTRTFGNCVTRSAPTAVRGLILSSIDSPEEAVAVRALGPSMGACLQAGQVVHFSRQMLRGYLAEALYKSSVAAKSSGAPGKAP